MQLNCEPHRNGKDCHVLRPRDVTDLRKRQPVDSATHYVKDGIVVERPSMPLAVSGARITGIPAGSVLTLGEQAFEVNDGEAEIDGYSGTVKITCWPYLDAEVVV